VLLGVGLAIGLLFFTAGTAIPYLALGAAYIFVDLTMLSSALYEDIRTSLVAYLPDWLPQPDVDPPVWDAVSMQMGAVAAAHFYRVTDRNFLISTWVAWPLIALLRVPFRLRLSRASRRKAARRHVESLLRDPALVQWLERVNDVRRNSGAQQDLSDNEVFACNFVGALVITDNWEPRVVDKAETPLDSGPFAQGSFTVESTRTEFLGHVRPTTKLSVSCPKGRFWCQSMAGSTIFFVSCRDWASQGPRYALSIRVGAQAPIECEGCASKQGQDWLQVTGTGNTAVAEALDRLSNDQPIDVTISILEDGEYRTGNERLATRCSFDVPADGLFLAWAEFKKRVSDDEGSSE
jgi:hypothetical protein